VRLSCLDWPQLALLLLHAAALQQLRQRQHLLQQVRLLRS
jgi:hypothetical protein